MSTTVIKRLDTRHLARHAREAIRERLGYAAPEALLAVERDGTTVVLRLNSGGNSLAVESYLRQHGYSAERAGSNPDGYGCALRVTVPATAPDGPMAITPDGIVKPVAEFTAAEKWWCDGEECGDDQSPPHVHCMMHRHPVDLVTGRSTDRDSAATAAGKEQER